MADDEQPTWADTPGTPGWPPEEQPLETWQSDETVADFAPAPPMPAWPGWPPPVVEADPTPSAGYAEYVAFPGQRMPREEAVVLARQWKRRVALGSVLTFGLLAALAAAHTANATTSTSASGTDGSSGSGVTTQPGGPSNPSSGGFFGQPGNGGINPSGSSGRPVTGSHAS